MPKELRRAKGFSVDWAMDQRQGPKESTNKSRSPEAAGQERTVLLSKGGNLSPAK